MTARSIPTFAVVGRTNKGKSSIVATLTENDRVLVAPTPRTTRHCQSFELRLDGEAMLRVIDTPGFEEAPAVLDWLKQANVPANRRQARVQEFLDYFATRDEFPFERELLSPIFKGATIIYVADGSHPYRANFEAELEILQWTGRPSLALINMVGVEDHSIDWRQALNQYFKIVRIFDAHKSHVPERIQLLRDLAVLDEELRRDINRIALQLERQHGDRLVKSARLIAELVNDAASYRLSVTADYATLTESEQAELVARYLDHLRALEGTARQQLARLFDYRDLQVEEAELEKPIFQKDLFSEEVWQVFGLTRLQTVTAGLVSGAVVGGAIDAAVGGASLLVGTALGSLIGSGTATVLAFREARVLGIKVSGSQRIVGPHANPNFPWIILDRALLYLRSVLQRTHARRDVMVVNDLGFVRDLKSADIRRLSRLFQRAKREDVTRSLEPLFVELVKECELRREAVK